MQEVAGESTGEYGMIVAVEGGKNKQRSEINHEAGVLPGECLEEPATQQPSTQGDDRRGDLERPCK